MSAPARPPAWSRILRLHARIDDLTADAVGYLTAFEAAGQPERAAAIARQLETALQTCVQDIERLLRDV
jgi:hypothetical protein